MKRMISVFVLVCLLVGLLPTMALAAEEPTPVASVSLDKNELVLKKGDTAQLEVTVLPDDATDITVTWSSDKTGVATVSNTGLVTAKSTGIATITATANDGSGVSASCTVKVNDGGTWGGIDWTLTADGTLTIAPTAGTPAPDPNTTKRTWEVGQWREKVIYNANGSAASIGGCPYDPAKVVELIIEEGVTSIGSFTGQGFTNLTGEVIIPSTVTYIGQECFKKSKFTKLTFAAGGTEELCIAHSAFGSVPIKEVSLPADRPVHLHAWVFGGCTELKTASLPASIYRIWGTNHIDYNQNFEAESNVTWASSSVIFTGCTAMETVTFGSEEIKNLFFANGRNGNGDDVWRACVDLTAYNSLQDAIDAAALIGKPVTLVKNVSIGSGTTLVIPEGVTFNLNGKTLTNAGSIINNGEIAGGTLKNNGVVENFGTVSSNVTNNGTYAADENAVNPDSQKFTGTAPASFYAIKYNLDDGVVAEANPISYHVGSATFTLTNPTKTGYTFSGWTGTGLDDVTESVTIATGSTGAREYTATWTPHIYSIAFDDNGGEGTMATIERVSYGTIVELPANSFTKSGYTFGGWNTAANGSGTDYANKASVSNLTTVDGGSVTLYAKWNEIVYAPPTYSAAAQEGVKLSTGNTYAGTTVRANVEEDSGFDGVRVFDSDGNLLRVDGKDGEFSFTMPGENVRVEPFANPFEDVVDEDYHHDAVIWGYANGITEGVAENLFGSEQDCTRAELVTFLWRLAGCPAPAGAQGEFEDVDPEAYYAAAVQWAAENGITEGTGEGEFSPDAACDRAQIAVFLCRMLEGTADGDGIEFTDVDPEAYYAAAVQWAAENGITVGTGDGTFSPSAICDRAQMIAFLWRCFAK